MNQTTSHQLHTHHLTNQTHSNINTAVLAHRQSHTKTHLSSHRTTPLRDPFSRTIPPIPPSIPPANPRGFSPVSSLPYPDKGAVCPGSDRIVPIERSLRQRHPRNNKCMSQMCRVAGSFRGCKQARGGWHLNCGIVVWLCDVLYAFKGTWVCSGHVLLPNVCCVFFFYFGFGSGKCWLWR